MLLYLRSAALLGLGVLLMASAHAAADAQPGFTVKSQESTRFYPVTGGNRAEVWSQLTGPANPLPVDPRAGTKPLGHASFGYQYAYQSTYAGDSSSCRVQTGQFEFRFETVLPRLVADASTRRELDLPWSSLRERIEEHEAGHHRIYRQLVTRLPQALTDIGAVPCAELAARVEQAVNREVEDIRRASEDYDRYHSQETYAISSL